MRFASLVNLQHVPTDHYRSSNFKDFQRLLKLLEAQGLVQTKPLTRLSFEEYKGVIHADENSTKQVTNVSVDKANDDDEDGALFVSFVSLHS